MPADEPYPLLRAIDAPADLRRLERAQLPALAEELRRYLIETVSQKGGHFAAGLGAVELSVALHYVYQTAARSVDLGCGPSGLSTQGAYRPARATGEIKHKGGLAPFPARHESPYDAFGVGHSSTSLSAALGMAIAAARTGNPRRVVAVIGDGAMSAGMAFEALNHIGALDQDMLVVLNDNDMSISEAIGAFSNYLARLLSGKRYADLRAQQQTATAACATGARAGARLGGLRTRRWCGRRRSSTTWDCTTSGPSMVTISARWSTTLRNLRGAAVRSCCTS